MYGDTQVIRKLALAMQEQASAIRDEADQLVRASQQVWWEGLAARAMRERMVDQAGALRRTADKHDVAAEALRRHAAEVDRLKELIRQLADRFDSLVTAARERLAGLADQAVDLVRRAFDDSSDEALVAFRPPPRGHRDWLEVPDRFPGVAA